MYMRYLISLKLGLRGLRVLSSPVFREDPDSKVFSMLILDFPGDDGGFWSDLCAFFENISALTQHIC